MGGRRTDLCDTVTVEVSRSLRVLCFSPIFPSIPVLGIGYISYYSLILNGFESLQYVNVK